MSSLQIKQIGNGGAFNYKETNSSFLIKNGQDLILFDCGHSVYQKLIELDETGEISLKDLKAVYISHFDDDHIGSLKTLIYYQYFINQIVLDVLVHNQLYQEMNYFLRDLDGYNDDFEKVPAQLFDLYGMDNENCEYGDLWLGFVECDHHVPCFGLIVADLDKNDTIMISGDTRANPEFEEVYWFIKDNSPDTRITVFHDFSNWDCPEKQVHMCETDMIETYSDRFVKELNFYHNDDSNYFKGWR
jgi:ribonuclease BN (tRNA processing enzyme)